MGRRRKQHEEHQNHEGWAIPYGDLVTLLLAFFVVMYAISQVNEGKYRVLSQSLQAAFRGEPTTIIPIQAEDPLVIAAEPAVIQLPVLDLRALAMRDLARQTMSAMDPLIRQGLVDVEVGNGKLTIAIRSDMLFESGSAAPSAQARSVAVLLGEVLRAFPVNVKVEGHTDNVPISSGNFPSNWELSAARAASVVHLLIASGVKPPRLAAVGYGEFQPVAPNATADGRNANRRVVLLVEADEAELPVLEEGEVTSDSTGVSSTAAPVSATPATPVPATATPAA